MKNKSSNWYDKFKLIGGLFAFMLLLTLNVNIVTHSPGDENVDNTLVESANAQVIEEEEEDNSAWRYVECGPEVNDICTGDGGYTCCK